MARVGGSSKQATLDPELIVSEIYASIALEYNRKFEKVEKLFSTMNSQIQSIELRVATIEQKLDDYEQYRLLDSLHETGPCFIFGMKQDREADLVTTVLDMAKKNDVILQKEQVLSMNRFRLLKATGNI
ncbi:hypothetical protein QYM36_015760 [Artemia franciscana]|uniref:Uncharacterized protein n=1 Tax=Artemia franciscana TaxID=6661 RepID=A0AA88H5R5_ARTSF|nr:hypothetical protein QYM36_015760 [Artemia franciscana]